LSNFFKSIVSRLFGTKAVLLITLCIVQPLHALEFECTTGDEKRFIRLELPGIEHLCEVSVTYTTDERKVIWYANHDSMFCSEKATELKTKYEDQWGFQCNQWPDHDGVDTLTTRQRTILDAELKLLMSQGQAASNKFQVEGLKVAATHSKDTDNLMVVQFFLHKPNSGVTNDVTHIIRDDGVSWNTQAKFDTLSSYVDANEGYIVNSALITAVSGNGAMEVITVLEPTDPLLNENSNTPGCYGNQTLTAQGNGQLIARTPHRYVCPEANDNDAG